ncbi:isochorismatase family protein [Streptomyces hyderabadensis]|uniref:N-carbamoylsarcosine amidohydrolase n=1 Tax=Streptomyces hyderabadensis TaxID=598549 RepID=A0ABP9HH97_9ACTN|nr:isochorismatase family protein [Streptomyces hyderabadensis]
MSATAPGEAAVRALYAQRGLGGRLAPGSSPVVLVVDLINGFTDPDCPPGSALDTVVAANRTLLDAARAVGTPVVFTTIAFAADGIEGAVWLRKMPAMKVLLDGTPWVEVDARLGRTENEPVVVKRAASAFANTGLTTLLATFGADSVIITGATTSGCVRATAVDACAAGYPAFVVSDCVGDRAAGPHEASLFDIDAKYGDVVGLEEALGLLPDAPPVPPTGGVAP